MNNSIFSKIRWPRPFAGLRALKMADVPRETMAGVTLAALMIPLNIGYAQVAGLPPASGLYAAIIPLVVFALIHSIPSANLYSMAVGVSAFLIVRLMKRYAPKVPGALVALVSLTIIVAMLDLPAKGVAVPGNKIESVLPALTLTP
jgi:MFS superfamily sulfate permease-like transporter